MASRVSAGVCASALAPAVAAGALSLKEWMHMCCGISRTAESCAYGPVCVPVARGGSVVCNGRCVGLSISMTYPCYFYRETDEYIYN